MIPGHQWLPCWERYDFSMGCGSYYMVLSMLVVGLMVRWTGLLFTSLQLGGAVQVMGSATFFAAIIHSY